MNKNETLLVSVIVPIYNVEAYLKRCVDSVLSQTYVNLEIILIDDGSPDNCAIICDDYKEKDNRIKVIHRSNGGLSDARNAGLDVATGEYVTFLDSDDWLQYDAIQTMMLDACMEILVCIDAVSVSDSLEKNIDRGTRIKKEISAYEFLIGINEQKYSCSSWGKLFPRELIKDFRFEAGKLNEDYLFLSILLLNVNAQVAIIDYKGYNYFVRQGSISRSGLGKSSVDAVYNTMNILSLASEKKPQLVPCIGAYAAFQARSALLLMNYGEYRKNKTFAQYCLKTIKTNLRYLSDSFMKNKDILFCYLCMIAPALTVQTARKYNRIHRKYRHRLME